MQILLYTKTQQMKIKIDEQNNVKDEKFVSK